jgi:hypothetical protein
MPGESQHPEDGTHGSQQVGRGDEDEGVAHQLQRANALGRLGRRQLRQGVRHEEQGGQEADRTQGDGEGTRQLARDRADDREIPTDADGDQEHPQHHTERWTSGFGGCRHGWIRGRWFDSDTRGTL